MIPLAWATDLLDPDGPGVNERGEWTDAEVLEISSLRYPFLAEEEAAPVAEG
ncbi:hypothetical protein AB0M48_14155 [Lentzea sp. NPDC051208]|uniref:hypothetical protein n=1 Tax=Lentzea sp. NPDC051208 TaxID=3154642 RepID=UPI00343BCA4B